MKFSLEWVNDHVDVAAAGGVLGVRSRLEQAGLPVESVEPWGGDHVLDVEITPNRPDAMGHRGIAREVAAMAGLTGRAAHGPSRGEPPSSGDGVERLTSLVNQVPRLCRRFGVRLVRGTRNGPSPDRVRTRLTRIGAKAISAAVDATNYGLWDTGQPLHAFDFDKLRGGLLIVRRAGKGETLVTLDGVERDLAPTDLVVADAERAVSLAGIMGGLETAVTEDTRNVLLEAAWWDPVTVRRTSRRLGLHTDASHRFERGADLEAIPEALALAARLILDAGGGTLAPGLLDAPGSPFRVRRATLRLGRLRALAGDDRLTLEFAEDALARLGFRPERKGKHLTVSIPLFRQDVRREEDLIEEVLRVYGYDRLPSRLPSFSAGGVSLSPLKSVEDRVADAAVGCGLYETAGFPFLDPAEESPFEAWLQAIGASSDRLRVVNPLDEGRRHLRGTLLPGILDAVSRNVRRGRASTGLFEVGRVFDRAGNPDDPETFESRRIAFAICGEFRAHWSDPPQTRPADFFDAKGIVERLLEAWVPSGSLEWGALETPGFTRGSTAVARLSSGTVVAIAGGVSRAERDRRRLPEASFAGEIRLDAIPRGGAGIAFRPYSDYPAIEADLTFTHSRDLRWAEIESALTKDKPEILESVRLLDRYEGEGVREGSVKTTVRLTFRSPNRTLEMNEVAAEEHALAGALRRDLGVEL